MAEAAYGGTYGGSYRLRMDCTEVSVNTGGNYSTVHIVVYMARVSSSGGDIYNLSATGWSANVDGQGYSGSITQGHLANGGTITMLDTYKDIGHNADGTRSYGYSASHNSNNSPYQTSASLSSSNGLTTINRYTSITGLSNGNPGPTSLDVYVTTSDTCDAIDYSLDNGGSWTAYSTGAFSSKTLNLTGLSPATTYNMKVRVRRADSGLWTYSGTTSGTTLGYATITSYTHTPITDVGFTTNVTTDYNCNGLEYKVNGGAWTAYGGATVFNSRSIYIGDLISDTDYTMQVRVKRADSGLWTNSSITTIHTLPQNNFFTGDDI